jgi:hypothetical protein
MVASGFGTDDKVPRAGGIMTGTLELEGTPPLLIPVGAGEGYVGTSDADGNFSWGPPSVVADPGNVTNPAFGADPTGTNYSDTAFAAAVANFVSTGEPVVIPAGTYKVQTAQDWMVAGMPVRTAGAENTKIIQETSNIPILQMAAQGEHVGGITLAYATQQTASQTGAIAVTFGSDSLGSSFMSTFDDLRIELCNTGLGTNPAIGTVAGVFSCRIENLEILGYSYKAINLIGGNNVGAADTQCLIGNLYIHNNYSGSDVNSTSWPVFFQNWSEVIIDVLNVEHAEIQDSDALVFAECGNVVIGGLHLEHLEVSGSPGYGLVGVGTGTGMVQIDGLAVRFCTFSGTSRNSIIRVTGGSGQAINLNGLTMPATDGGDSTSAIPIIDFNSATNVTAQLTGINGTASQLWTETYANAGAGCQVTLAPIAGAAAQAPATTFTGPVTAEGGIVPATTGWTVWPSGGMLNALNVTSGGGVTPVAGTWYVVGAYIGCNCSLTGIIAAADTGTGTDDWIAAVWGAAGGTALAHSSLAGTAAPAANAKAKFSFTSVTGVEAPGLFFYGIQSNGTTDKIFCFNNNLEGFPAASFTGTFGTLLSLTPPTTYTTLTGPMCCSF